MWWIVMLVGAGFVLTPGMVDPFAPINGATIIGFALIAWAVTKLMREGNVNE